MPKSDVEVSLDWSSADASPVQPANQFAVTATDEGHVLTLGLLAPPVVLTARDRERVSRMQGIQPQIAARVVLSPTSIQQLVRVLTDNIERRRRIGAQEPST